VRVIQKGSPVTTSVRYIGPQLRRACLESAPGADSDFLRDALTGYARGLWGGAPPVVNPQQRYAVWETPAAQLFAACGAGMRSADIKRHIRGLTEEAASHDPGLRYAVRVLYGRPLRGISALRAVFRAIQRNLTAAPALYEGFTLPLRRDGGPFQALADTVMPSAKRLKQLVDELGPAETKATQRRVAAAQHSVGYITAAPLPAAQAAAQMALPVVFALFCATCGEWRSRPIVPGKLSSVVVDLDAAQVACQRCLQTTIFRVLVNGVVLRCDATTWARLCSGCGQLLTNPTLHRDGALCGKCLDAVAVTAIGCYCGRPAVAARLGIPTGGGRYAVGVACAHHARLLPTAPDGDLAHVLMQ
jgi:hypothetical protein